MRTRFRRGILPVLLFFAGVSVCGENLIFNGSFEMGPVGYAMEKELRADGGNRNLEFIPLKSGAGAPGSGAQSLSIENPFAEKFEVYSKEFLLEPSTTYKVTGFYKSSGRDASIRFAVYRVDPSWTAYGESFPGSETWRPFEFKFTTAEKAAYCYLLIRPGDLAAIPAASYWVDGLELRKTGTPSSSLTIEAAAIPDRTLYQLEPGAGADITLHVFNPTAARYRGAATIAGRDEYTKQLLFQKQVQMELEPGETRKITFSQPLARCGSVRLETSAENLRSHDGFYSVIGQYTPLPVDLSRDAVVGLQGGLLFLDKPRSRVPAFQVFNAPPGADIELLGRMGCRVMRDGDYGLTPVDWTLVEAERGKFDFTRSEQLLAIYTQNNMELLEKLGGGFIDTSHNTWLSRRWPEWLVAQAERVRNAPDHCVPALRGKVMLPPLELFAAYVRETACRFKGRIRVYELFNEPNLYLAPDVYVRYQKAAYEAIKSVDPDAIVLAFSVTTDFGASYAAWLAECLRLGAAAYADAVSFHPYESPELGSPAAADEAIRQLRALLPEGMPVWNTELYYLFDHGGPTDTYAQVQCAPHHIIRRFLTDLGENVVQSNTLPSQNLWKSMLTPNMKASPNCHELIPSENFVACNAMARLFEGARVERKFRFPAGVICYAYRKNGKPIAAVWNYRQRKGVHGDLSGFDVMDLFGNPVKAEEKTLADAPYYLTPGKFSEAEFFTKLATLPVRVEEPVSVAPELRLVDGVLWAGLRNDGPVPVKGAAGISGGGIVAVSPVFFEIPGNESRTCEIPIRRAGNPAGTPSVLINGNGHTVRTPVRYTECKTAKAGEPISVRSVDGKLSVTGTVELSAAALTLNFDVGDTTDAGPSGTGKPWETDGLELFFDLSPEQLSMRDPSVYTDRVFRLYVLPRDRRVIQQGGEGILSPEEISYTQAAKADGYTVRIAIPAAKLKLGKYLGFDFKANDTGASAETGVRSACWSGADDGYKNRLRFGIIVNHNK